MTLTAWEHRRMSVITRARRQLRALYEPAPMADFEDFDEYWERRGPVPTLFRRWVIAADLIPAGATVLDVGCGSGDFLRYLRTRRPDADVLGIDGSERAVAMTREAGFAAEVVSDAMSADLPVGFDIVTAFEILEHIPEAEVAIQRWSDAAQSFVIVSIPNVGYIGCRLRLALFGRFPTTNCVFHIKEHLRHWTLKDFREWTERLHLRVTHVAPQYGFPGLRRVWPGLFAKGLVYRVEPMPSRGPSASD